MGRAIWHSVFHVCQVGIHGHPTFFFFCLRTGPAKNVGTTGNSLPLPKKDFNGKITFVVLLV